MSCPRRLHHSLLELGEMILRILVISTPLQHLE